MLTTKQRDILLRPLNPARVHQRTQAGRSFSYLEAWDVKAHLIRIFGHLGWSADVKSADLVFEDSVPSKQGGSNWSVAYKVLLTLRVHAAGDDGGTYASYTEAAIGSAQLPSRGDAHDMAIKTAESDALKRAAINLGDQFGLSLYANGALSVVKGVIAPGYDEEPAPVDEPA